MEATQYLTAPIHSVKPRTVLVYVVEDSFDELQSKMSADHAESCFAVKLISADSCSAGIVLLKERRRRKKCFI